MLHNRTKQDTNSDSRQTVDNDFPSDPTNCNKVVIQRECNATYVLRVLDMTELGMGRVPKCDGTFCKVCELPVLRQGNARANVAFGNCRSVDLLDKTAKNDEKVVVGPEETSVK